MNLNQSVFLSAALSLPVVTVIAIIRAALCIYRSKKKKHLMFTVFASLNIVLMLVIFSGVAIVWFTYAVAHTGKDASTDLIILAGTGAATYAGACLVWWLSQFMESRLVKNGT
jgi:hypothetical protein